MKAAAEASLAGCDAGAGVPPFVQLTLTVTGFGFLSENVTPTVSCTELSVLVIVQELDWPFVIDTR